MSEKISDEVYKERQRLVFNFSEAKEVRDNLNLKKQEIVQDYLERGWGINRKRSSKYLGYNLITPSGKEYSLSTHFDLNCYTSTDVEFIDDNSFEELIKSEYLVRVLRSIRDSSVLECLVDVYRTFKSKS